jgi:hypothetical protein
VCPNGRGSYVSTDGFLSLSIATQLAQSQGRSLVPGRETRDKGSGGRQARRHSARTHRLRLHPFASPPGNASLVQLAWLYQSSMVPVASRGAFVYLFFSLSGLCTIHISFCVCARVLSGLLEVVKKKLL